MSEGGFFDAVRNSHPYRNKLGKEVKGKRIVATYNKSEPGNIWGVPWVSFEDGTEVKVSDMEKEG